MNLHASCCQIFALQNSYTSRRGEFLREHFRVGFIKNFDFEAAGLGEDYMYPDTGQDYRYFPSQIFKTSPAQIPRLSVVCFCHRR